MLEEAKIKNNALFTNPELYKILWPEEFRPKSQPMVDEDGLIVDEDIEYVVPRDESELQSVFDDLKNLGFAVDDDKLPSQSAPNPEQNAAQNVDADLEKEVNRMFNVQMD